MKFFSADYSWIFYIVNISHNNWQNILKNPQNQPSETPENPQDAGDLNDRLRNRKTRRRKAESFQQRAHGKNPSPEKAARHVDGL